MHLKRPQKGRDRNTFLPYSGPTTWGRNQQEREHAKQLGTITRTATAVAAQTIESGICAGTTIMTLDGEIPVEHLSVGDRIITHDAGMSIIKAIKSRDVKMREEKWA